MRLKNPQAKGRRFEYQVRDQLRESGYNAQRSPMSGAISFLKGDILGTPFFIECKNTEKSQFLLWYKKAKDQAQGQPVIIAWTANNQDAYVFLALSDLLAVINEKPIQAIKKPQKPKKQAMDDTAGFAFSKAKQLKKATP